MWPVSRGGPAESRTIYLNWLPQREAVPQRYFTSQVSPVCSSLSRSPRPRLAITFFT